MITPFRSLVLCGANRQDMEDWIGALKTAAETRPQDAGTAELLGGNHQWYATSHARPTYCNVCRDALYGDYNFFLFLPSSTTVFLALFTNNLRLFALQGLLHTV